MALNMPILDFISQYRNVLYTSLKKCVSKGRIKAVKNLMTVELQHLYRSPRLKGYPYLLTIETGNVCPLHCPLCPTGQNQKRLPKGFLDFKDFKKIMDEIGEYLIQVMLYNWGEPLLNEDIFDMVRVAESKGISTVMSTTLTSLDEETKRELISSGLDILIVSLDGASQETVEKYQQGNDFKKVIENMKAIQEAKRKLNTTSPSLQWRYIVNKYNEHEIPKARKMAKKMGANLELAPISCDMYREIFMTPEEQFEDAKPWLPEKEKYSLYDYEKGRRKKILENDCSNLWRHAVINWDGSVFPCCWVHDPEYSFGNAFEEGFKTIWNNEKYVSARKLIGKSKKSETSTICNICYENKAMI